MGKHAKTEKAIALAKEKLNEFKANPSESACPVCKSTFGECPHVYDHAVTRLEATVFAAQLVLSRELARLEVPKKVQLVPGWYARAKNIKYIGPFASQQIAFDAVTTVEGLPAPEAYVWSVAKKDTRPCPTTKKK